MTASISTLGHVVVGVALAAFCVNPFAAQAGDPIAKEWKKEIAEFHKMMKQRHNEHYNQQHQENAEFQKTLKGLKFVERVPLIVAHMDTQFSENQAFRTEQYGLRKEFVTKLMTEAEVDAETQAKIITMLDTLYTDAMTHWQTQHDENDTVLSQLAADTTMTPKDRKAALKAHREQQKAENKQFHCDRKAQWTEFWASMKDTLRTASWKAVFFDDTTKEEKETDSGVASCGTGGCK